MCMDLLRGFYRFHGNFITFFHACFQYFLCFSKFQNACMDARWKTFQHVRLGHIKVIQPMSCACSNVHLKTCSGAIVHSDNTVVGIDLFPGSSAQQNPRATHYSTSITVIGERFSVGLVKSPIPFKPISIGL